LRRFVALGDSFTEGLEDPYPDGAYRGWADLVAEHLNERWPGLLYANLAVRGRKLARIRDEQVAAAIEMAPDLVTIAAGGNDVMGLACDVEELGRAFHNMLHELSETGATVIAFAGFDPRRRIPVAQMQGVRADHYNAFIRAACIETGATLVDLWCMEELYEPAMWAPDRLHLSPLGHELIAAQVLRALGESASLPDPGVAAEPGWFVRQAQDAVWAGRYLAPWLWRGVRGRSSGDGRDAKRPLLSPVAPSV
jgi:lysophospholipase L1-like esterase